MLGVMAAVLVGSLFLFGLGQALGGRGAHQRGADLAAVSAAMSMRSDYPRLFEAPVLAGGVPNPRHLTTATYLARARAAAVRAGARNRIGVDPDDVEFPGGGGFAPVRVRVKVRGKVDIAVGGRGDRRRAVPVAASATAELDAAAGGFAYGSGGGYSGPLAQRLGKPMRPDVAQAFDRLAAAAARDGLTLSITSAFRSDAEQARLFAANPDPKWVARPGTSLHRYATELDLGPPSAYAWLAANAGRYGFRQRYSWEAWHYGYVRNPGSSSLGFGTPAGRGRSSVPSFVPERFRATIARAAQRWSVGAGLLSAQIYVESGFNPFATSPAGAQGIAQFMPDTARAMGLDDAFDPAKAIDAQARLMRDLLGRFGSVPLALAGYNAGPGAVDGCGCVPAYPETQAYVAKILKLLGGGGEGVGSTPEVRLVE